MFAARGQGGDPALDSDADAQGRTGAFALDGTAATIATTSTAVSSPPLQSQGLVFTDRNGDGRRTSGEGGIAGVTFQLWNPGADGAPGGGDDTLLNTAVSDAQADISLANLCPRAIF